MSAFHFNGYPITIDDNAVGFATLEAGRHRFITVDPRLAALDGAVFDSAGAARRLAEAMLAAGNVGHNLAIGDSAASRVLSALQHRYSHFQTRG